MKKKYYFLSLFFAFVCVFTFWKYSDGSTDINACGTLDTPGETYVFTQDIDVADNHCFIIGADNITIDGAGYDLNQTGAPDSYIAFDASGQQLGGGQNYNGTTIKNLSINSFEKAFDGSGVLSGNIGGASVTLLNVTTSANIIANGSVSNDDGRGGNGGEVYIATSTVGEIYSAGADGADQGSRISTGGNGGRITLVNSTAELVQTTGGTGISGADGAAGANCECDDGDGSPGADGESGRDGGSGGHVYLVDSSSVSGSITTTGGSGGNGGAGGAGGAGGSNSGNPGSNGSEGGGGGGGDGGNLYRTTSSSRGSYNSSGGAGGSPSGTAGSNGIEYENIPYVNLTSPTNGATVSGTSVNVTADASSFVGTDIAGVRFRIGDVSIGAEDTSAPYSASLDSTGYSNGSHTLSAIARNISGNYATSSITITIDNSGPIISSIASTTSATSATTTWNTSESSDSRVWYGTTSGVYTTSRYDGTATLSHTLPLLNLSPITTYFYIIVSRDAAGNYSTSTEKALRTTETLITWTMRTNSGVSNSWVTGVLSDDGSKAYAISTNKHIKYSSDYGVTWATSTNSNATLNWLDITTSADGTKVYAVVGGTGGSFRYIYRSTDSGVTWATTTAAGSKNWSSVSTSADGATVVATDQGSSGPGGWIHISTDSGVTWATTTAAGARGWTDVTISRDGTKIVAVAGAATIVSTRHVMISTNSGSTWATSTTASPRTWSSVASSADASKLVILASNASTGLIQLSTNSGSTWATSTNIASKDWFSSDSSDDGTKLIAAAQSDYVYTSSDSGNTWLAQTNLGALGSSWRVSSSADGNRLLAVGVSNYIYTGVRLASNDPTAPSISSVATSTTDTTATITWTTNESASSTVRYGTTVSYGTASTTDNLNTSHTIVLSGLTSGTLYQFRVEGSDSFGNTATSSNYTFTTTGGGAPSDTTPPSISSVASTTDSSSATITWTTDEAASSTVNYGLSSSYTTTSNNDTLTTSHSVTLTGLSASTLYHFRVGGSDSSGNTSTSTDYTFLTSASSSSSHAAGVSNPGAGGGGGIIYPTDPYIPPTTNPGIPPNPPTPPSPLPNPAPANTQFLVNLSYRDEGSEVLRLQQYLAAQGYLKATPNGVFGPATLAAVKQFQMDHDIHPAAGYFGPLTRAYINQSTNTPNTPTPNPTPTTSHTFTTNLSYHDQGTEVLHLQNYLAQKGYLTATPNGYFGPATLRALTSFQRDNNISPTGYFGPVTRAFVNNNL